LKAVKHFLIVAPNCSFVLEEPTTCNLLLVFVSILIAALIAILYLPLALVQSNI
jgi:hypothetical protein